MDEWVGGSREDRKEGKEEKVSHPNLLLHLSQPFQSAILLTPHLPSEGEQATVFLHRQDQ